MKQALYYICLLAFCPSLVFAQFDAARGNNNRGGNNYQGIGNNGQNNRSNNQNGYYGRNSGNNNPDGGWGRGNGSSYMYDCNINYGSALSIFSESGDRFYLILNGIKQNTYPQTRIRIEGLLDIVNDIQIIFDDNQTPAINRRINFIDPVEGNAVNLTMRVTRDRRGAARLAFHKLTPLEATYRGERGEYIMQYNQRPVQVDPRTYNQLPTPPIPVAMDMQTFAAAKQTIKGSSFDDGRLSTAKTVVNSNYLNIDQVIEICKLFTWDETKLAFAKYAYNKTVDNANYFRVNNVFTWDSNKQALNDFISNGGR